MPGHLIHIGFPKAGSTFLQEWFHQHPQLFYTPGGLGGFNNVYEISRKASQNDDPVFAYFVTSDESLTTPVFSTGTIPIEHGRRDVTSFKLDKMAQRKACTMLKCLYPNAKILFITRSFQGIIMSGYSQYLKVGGIKSLKEFAAASIEAMQIRKDQKDNGGELDFTFIINIFEEAFHKENMIVLPFELLRDNQKKFLSIIEARLGLTHFEETIKKKNESLSPEELYWYPRISSVVSAIAQQFGEKVYARVYRWYVAKTLTNKLRKVIKVMSWLQSRRGISNADFPTEAWDYFRENHAGRFAGSFRNDPVYIPYLHEYLLSANYREFV